MNLRPIGFFFVVLGLRWGQSPADASWQHIVTDLIYTAAFGWWMATLAFQSRGARGE